MSFCPSLAHGSNQFACTSHDENRLRWPVCLARKASSCVCCTFTTLHHRAKHVIHALEAAVDAAASIAYPRVVHTPLHTLSLAYTLCRSHRSLTVAADGSKSMACERVPEGLSSEVLRTLARCDWCSTRVDSHLGCAMRKLHPHQATSAPSVTMVDHGCC